MTRETMTTRPRTGALRRGVMLEPDEVSTALKLKGLGRGARRIAAEPGCSRTTAKREANGPRDRSPAWRGG